MGWRSISAFHALKTRFTHISFCAKWTRGSFGTPFTFFTHVTFGTSHSDGTCVTFNTPSSSLSFQTPRASFSRWTRKSWFSWNTGSSHFSSRSWKVIQFRYQFSFPGFLIHYAALGINLLVHKRIGWFMLLLLTIKISHLQTKLDHQQMS